MNFNARLAGKIHRLKQILNIDIVERTLIFKSYKPVLILTLFLNTCVILRMLPDFSVPS